VLREGRWAVGETLENWRNRIVHPDYKSEPALRKSGSDSGAYENCI
jgi:hypothetical protein